MTDLTDPNSLADALDNDAMRCETLDQKLQDDDPCKWGGADTLFWIRDMRAAAALLRRQGEALAALTDAIGDREQLRHDITQALSARVSVGRSGDRYLVGGVARDLLTRTLAAFERPTLDDTEERSDG